MMKILVLAPFLLLPLAASGQGTDEWEQQVRDQLAMASADLRDIGYVATGQPVVGASDSGVVESVELSLVTGADYVVVGRPITQAPDPAAAAMRISQELAGS